MWGLGNHLSNHPTSDEWPPATQDGASVSIAVQRTVDGAISVEPPVLYPTWCDRYPTWCDRDDGWVIRLTSEADDSNVSQAARDQLGKSHERTAKLLGWFLAAP